MSNSQRAKERRQHRSRIDKRQRDIMAKQHNGDIQGANKPTQAERDKSLAEELGLVKQ